MSSDLVAPRTPSGLTFDSLRIHDGMAGRSSSASARGGLDAWDDLGGLSRSGSFLSACSWPAPVSPSPSPPATPRSPARSEEPPPCQYERGLLGKLRVYHSTCLNNGTYRRSLLWMLVGQVGDGLMIGASGRILKVLRVPAAVRNTWLLLLMGTGEKGVAQGAELFNANARDNNRANRNGRDGQEPNPVRFRREQLQDFRATRWFDVLLCGTWIAIAVGTAVVGTTLWPVAVATAAVGIAMAWNRSRRNVSWENLRFNKEFKAKPTCPEDMVVHYGSTIGTAERILCTAAYGVGAATATAIEVFAAPACLAVSIGIVVGTLAGGCALGTFSRWRQACAVASEAVVMGAAGMPAEPMPAF